MKVQAVKGTFDILPDIYTEDIHKKHTSWQHVYDVSEAVLSRAGVHELTPPTLERLEVFTKSVGESSDIVVQKEMYSFEDAGGRQLALRPELTAGVMRAFINQGLQVQPFPVKLWSKGPVFRAERKPQRGRYRQFHQVNCEFIGLAEPMIDAEAIALLYTLLQQLGIRAMEVKLGSVGDPQDRAAYNAYLRQELSAHASELSETSQARLRLNPMRVLDSKDARDQHIVAELKRPLDFLNDEARAHLEAVRHYLDALSIPYTLEPAMVRGLDYYQRTAFEIHHTSIGAQSALCGGGRYDGLIGSLGGGDVPGIGWAFGVERILDAMAQDNAPIPLAAPLNAYLIALDDDALDENLRLAFALRTHGLRVAQGYKVRKIGKGLQDADKAHARFAVVRGEDERTQQQYQVKQLASGVQHSVAESELIAWLESNRTS